MDSTIYATAKWAGERHCQALGQRANGSTTFACIRIGWCQPGENRPDTLSAAGTPTQAQGEQQESPTDRWYKSMWLSIETSVSSFIGRPKQTAALGQTELS